MCGGGAARVEDRGAGALVPGAGKPGVRGRAQKKWGRGRDVHRIRPRGSRMRCRGRYRGCHGGVLVGDFGVHTWPVGGSWRRGKRGKFAGCARTWGGIGRATVTCVLTFSFRDLYLGGKIICAGNRAAYCGRYCFQTVIRWIGMGWRRKIIISRASGISPYIR